LGQFSQRSRNPPSLAPVSRRRTEPAPDFRPRKRGGGAFAGILIALAGVGGAYAIIAQKGGDPMATVKKMVAMIHPAEAAPTSTPFSLTEESDPKTAPGAQGAAPTPKGPSGIQISALPAAMAGQTATAPSSSPVSANPPSANADPSKPKTPAPQAHDARETHESTALKAALAPKPEKTPVAAPVEKAAAPVEKAAPEPPPVEPAGPPGLVGAIKKAAGPLEKAPKEAPPEESPVKLSNGEIPESPAQGAIQGALGAQRGAARACMDGQSAPSRAAVVFASTGKVQSVTVAGPAAGTSAEACIKKALSRASVGPFSRPTFQVSLTITPP
jgi:hypothetical protein